jgi:cobalt-zinc-cadmium efflux system protein
VGHSHGTAKKTIRSKLIVVLIITLFSMIAQVIGAYLSNSVALLADAGHMFTDVTGLAISIVAISLATKAVTDRQSFGWFRLEIFAAAFNAMLLLGLGVFITYQGIVRWNSATEIEAVPMIVFACIGLLANLVGITLLRADSKENLNVKGAYLEVLSDTFGSVAVIISAIIIALTGWERADIIASLFVVALIVPRAVQLLRESASVLLQSTPRDIDVVHISDHLLAIPEVQEIHDLHVWTLTSRMPVLSVHVVVSDSVFEQGRTGEILDKLGDCLGEHFEVDHCTFQLEPLGHKAHERVIHG